MTSYPNFDTSALNCTSRGKWILFCAVLQHSYKVKYFIVTFYCYERRHTQTSILVRVIVPVSQMMCRLQHIEMKFTLHVCCSIEETVSCLEQRPITEITPPHINVVTQWRNSFLYVPKVPEMCRVTVAFLRAYTILVKSFTGTTAFIQYIPTFQES